MTEHYRRMGFCGYCGMLWPCGGEDRRPEKGRPGREWPGVGVGVLVRRPADAGDELLMVRRAGAHGAGTWSVPGGWVEYGEDPMDAAVREVRDETGLVVAAMTPMGWSSAVPLFLPFSTWWDPQRMNVTGTSPATTR